MNFQHLQNIEAFLEKGYRDIQPGQFGEEMAGFYREVDAFIEQTVNAAKSLYDGPPLCQAGCSYCCHQILIVSYAEAFYIHAELRKNENWPAHLKKLRQRIHRAEEHLDFSDLAELDFESHQRNYQELYARYNHLQLPCVFLDEQGYCSIYPFRPLTCRDAHVFEGDPVDCRVRKNPVVRTILLQKTYRLLANGLSRTCWGKTGGGELFQLIVHLEESGCM